MADRKRSPAASRHGGAVAALALALAILLLGVPRLIAAFWDSFHDVTIGMIYAQMPVGRADLQGLAASRRLALGWAPTGKRHAELAVAYLALAQSPGTGQGAEDEDWFARALAATRDGLALAPADARGWLQHAYLTMLDSRGATAQAAAALDLSLRLGPYDAPEVVLARAHLSLSNWALLGQAARERVMEQIRLAWRLAPQGAIGLASVPEFLPLVATALAEEPLAQAMLEEIAATMDEPEI